MDAQTNLLQLTLSVGANLFVIIVVAMFVERAMYKRPKNGDAKDREHPSD